MPAPCWPWPDAGVPGQSVHSLKLMHNAAACALLRPLLPRLHRLRPAQRGSLLRLLLLPDAERYSHPWPWLGPGTRRWSGVDSQHLDGVIAMHLSRKGLKLREVAKPQQATNSRLKRRRGAALENGAEAGKGKRQKTSPAATQQSPPAQPIERVARKKKQTERMKESSVQGRSILSWKP